jgi:hypothetical protein
VPYTINLGSTLIDEGDGKFTAVTAALFGGFITNYEELDRMIGDLMAARHKLAAPPALSAEVKQKLAELSAIRQRPAGPTLAEYAESLAHAEADARERSFGPNDKPVYSVAAKDEGLTLRKRGKRK